ncbi:MAG: GNAT family N-acetyltransferase [Stackebrandtia sp.]
MEITRVDPFDDAALASWHAAMEAGAGYGRVDPPIWTVPELAVEYRRDAADKDWEHEIYAAVDGDATVGTLAIEYPLKDNLTLGEVEINVRPEHRRRGVGAALYAHAARRLRELGRTTVGAAVQQPVDAEQVPGTAFAESLGFTRRNVEMRRRLGLPVDGALLDELAAPAAEAASGYVVRTWRGRCPDEFAEQYAHLRAMISVEAPLGEIEYEMEKWDVERLRAEEDVATAQDRIVLTAVAVAPDASLAGHTQLAVPGHEKVRVFQGDTLVLDAHRGHKLGMALKIANLRVLQEEFPDRTHVDTWNAKQNGPMNAVNNALGFYSLESFEEWQRRLEPADV